MRRVEETDTQSRIDGQEEKSANAYIEPPCSEHEFRARLESLPPVDQAKIGDLIRLLSPSGQTKP